VQPIDSLVRLSSLLPDSAALASGALTLAGLRFGELAETFGTPLYIYDEQTLRASARSVLGAFSPLGARVSFASKACDTIAILAVLRDEGLDLDVVSEGELAAALRAGFQPRQIHLHGNCKSDAELEAAIRLGLHAIVVDNIEELERLVARVGSLEQPVAVMLRITLPFEADTHPHLQTSGCRSKFGFYRGSAEERAAIDLLASNPGLRLTGLHTHVGSQIADIEIYGRVSRELLALGRDLFRQGHPISEIAVGGGWAVPNRTGDALLAPEKLASALGEVFAGSGFRPAIEPGRFLVSRAAVALYRIGSVKNTPTGRIVAVDGGMGDNIRPALYGARYEVLLPERLEATPIGPVDIAGRYCESGDFLARAVYLPAVNAGDLIAMPFAGAYQLSMASAYNLVPPPAAVLVAGGHARLIVRRATIDDLLACHVD